MKRAVVVVAVLLAGCGAFGRAILQATADDFACALGHIDQPDDVIVKDCFDKLAPPEREKAMGVVHAQRAYAAHRVAMQSCGGGK